VPATPEVGPVALVSLAEHLAGHRRGARTPGGAALRAPQRRSPSNRRLRRGRPAGLAGRGLHRAIRGRDAQGHVAPLDFLS